MSDLLCCCNGLLRNMGYLLTYCFNDNVICLHKEFNKFNKNTSMILLNLASNSVNKITIDAINIFFMIIDNDNTIISIMLVVIRHAS